MTEIVALPDIESNNRMSFVKYQKDDCRQCHETGGWEEVPVKGNYPPDYELWASTHYDATGHKLYCTWTLERSASMFHHLDGGRRPRPLSDPL